MNEKRVVIYGRRSQEERIKQVFSLDSQVDKCMDFAKSKGYIVVDTFLDEISGGEAERPEFDELIAGVYHNKYDYILATESSRIFRDVDRMNFFRNWLREKRKVPLILVDQPEANDDGGFTPRIIQGLYGRFDEEYRVEISKRIKYAKDKLSQLGLHLGHPPYGYYRKEPRSPLTPLAEEVEVIRSIYESFVTGLFSYKEIAEALNADGVKNRGEGFRTNTIRHILKNRFYLGHFVFHGKWYEHGQHEPIIDPELFDRCQDMSASRNVNKKSPPKRKTYVFSRLAHCCNCGYFIHVWFSEKKGRFYQHDVSLSSHVRDCELPKRKVSALKLETKWDMICGEIVLPDEWKEAIYRKAGLERYIDPSQETIRIERQIAEAKRKFVNLEIDENRLAKKLAELQNQLERLQTMPKLMLDVDAFLQTLKPFLAQATLEEKQQIMQLLLNDLKINSENWNFVGVEPSPLFRELFRPICLAHSIELIQPTLRIEK